MNKYLDQLVKLSKCDTQISAFEPKIENEKAKLSVFLQTADQITLSIDKNYAEIEKFKKNNIEIYFQNYNHPIYTQLYGNFIPYLSVIDLLFNMGSSSSEIIRSHNISKV